MRRPTPSVPPGDRQVKGGRTPAKSPTPGSEAHSSDIVTDAPGPIKGGPVDRLTYRLAEVADLLGVSQRTIERERAAGRFPRPDCRIGKAPLWTRETLTRWITDGGAE